MPVEDGEAANAITHRRPARSGEIAGSAPKLNVLERGIDLVLAEHFTPPSRAAG
ncbi:hypothetical protein [Streptomyces sp. NPDC001530]|uniref:hypothetical protein n=1 Tax=Streptomyces sp. NPDC001530 TaxID=3364582 RepID=UPI003677D599